MKELTPNTSPKQELEINDPSTIKVDASRFSPEKEANVLDRLILIGNEISTLEEEAVIMSKAIALNGEKDNETEVVVSDSLKKITGFSKDFKITPVSHERILSLVPVLADMIKRLRHLKIEERNLVAQLQPLKREAYYATVETRTKIQTGKIYLPEWIVELVEPVSIEKAKEIMGYLMIGPDEIEQKFQTHIDDSEVPPMPFTLADLKRAKERGDRLLLRIDKIKNVEGDYDDLTLEYMSQLQQSRDLRYYQHRFNYRLMVYRPKPGFPAAYLIDEKKFDESLRQALNFDTPRTGWVLIEKPIKKFKFSLLDSTVELRNRVASWADDNELADCSDEKLEEIAFLKEINPKKMMESLIKLKVNQKYRRTPVEFFYDEAVFGHYDLDEYFDESGHVRFGVDDLIQSEQTLATDSNGNFMKVFLQFNKSKPNQNFCKVVLGVAPSGGFSVVRS